MSAAEVPGPDQLARWHAELSNWGRWGEADELGTLNLLTAERRAAAAALVATGRTVSLAHDLAVRPTAEVPAPAHHHMLASGDALEANGIPGYQATRDYVGTDVHGLGTTHLDALCHMFVDGRSYNGRTPDTVTSTGATAGTVLAMAGGIVGRGVLLDVARARGVDHLAGGDVATPADLEAAEEAAGMRVGEGDVLLVGTGRDAWRRAAGGLDPVADGMAGLHPACLPWLHGRGVAALGGDGISDPIPGLGIERWPFPVHQVGMTALGLPLLDNLALGELAEVAAAEGRWAFLVVVAPLRVPGGTGCPVNPVAVF